MPSFDDLVVCAGGFKGLFASIRKNGQNLEKEVEGFLREESGLFGLAKFSVKKLEPGHAELSFPYGDAVARHGGIVHGGIISFALDTVGGLACMPNNSGIDQVTIALTVNFLKPLKKEPFRAIGKELRNGRTTSVAEMEMRDGDNDLCAVALGTWYKIFKPRE